MIQRKELIEMGFTLSKGDDFVFYEKQLTNRNWLLADKSKDGWYVTVDVIQGYIENASDVKKLIEIFNRANNGKG
jgi:hypothetical protein